MGIFKIFKDFVTVKGVENFQILITIYVSEHLCGEMGCVGKVEEAFICLDF